MKRLRKIYLLLVTWMICFPGFSQTCCSGGVPISGNVGMPSAFSGTFQVNMGYDINYLHRLKSGSELLEDNSRKRITNTLLFNSSYSVNDQFSFELLISYVEQVRSITNTLSNITDRTNGLGDAVILMRYSRKNLLFPDAALTIGAGPKLPLGRSDLKNRSGITLNADMQPGSGSWDLISFLHYSFPPSENSSLRIFIRAGFSARGTNQEYFNTQSYRSGNEYTLFAGINNMVSVGKSVWNYQVGGKMRKSGKDNLDGFDMPNTGGDWFYGVVSLGYNISPSTLFHITSDIPISSNPEGTQLNTTFRLNTGLFVNFGKRYSSILIK